MSHASGERKKEILYIHLKNFEFFIVSSHCIQFLHLIWSTKGRKDFILPMIEERLYSYIGGIIRKNHGNLLEIGGIAYNYFIAGFPFFFRHFVAIA